MGIQVCGVLAPLEKCLRVAYTWGKKANRELIRSDASSFSEDIFLASQALSFPCEKPSFHEGREHGCCVHHQYILGPAPNSVRDKPGAQYVFVKYTVFLDPSIYTISLGNECAPHYTQFLPCFWYWIIMYTLFIAGMYLRVSFT